VEAQRASLRSALALEVVDPAPTPVAVGLGLLALLTLLAEEQPVLVCVDDAQWLDESSALLVWFAARRLVTERVAVIVATRDCSPDGAAQVDLELCELALQALEQLLEPYGMSAAVGRTCWELAGGNALALVWPRVSTAPSVPGGDRSTPSRPSEVAWRRRSPTGSRLQLEQSQHPDNHDVECESGRDP
jgi:hypothetical protein